MRVAAAEATGLKRNDLGGYVNRLVRPQFHFPIQRLSLSLYPELGRGCASYGSKRQTGVVPFALNSNTQMSKVTMRHTKSA